MNVTKQDLAELKKRFTKKDCSISKVCGCYVNSNREIILKFDQPFLDLEDEEFHKYLEIVKKVFSGSIGNNVLSPSFFKGADAEMRQQYLRTLQASKLKNQELLDRLYEQIIAQYSYAGNYLILAFHDIYDVVSRAADRTKLDESEEIYEYILCAICPVELSKPALGYREEEHRIGARQRDWIVGAPDLGFVYPAFIDHGSDVNACLFYLKNPKETPHTFAEQVLGCGLQRTATQEKLAFADIVKDAFGGKDDAAEAAFLRIQKNIHEIVEEHDALQDTQPICLTTSTVTDLLSDLSVPEPIKEQITQTYAHTFGDTPPVAEHLLDAKLVAASAQRERTLALEEQVSNLKQQLSQVDSTVSSDHAPWEADSTAQIVLHVRDDKVNQIKAQQIDGKKYLVIPIADGECARINGVATEI